MINKVRFQLFREKFSHALAAGVAVGSRYLYYLSQPGPLPLAAGCLALYPAWHRIKPSSLDEVIGMVLHVFEYAVSGRADFTGMGGFTHAQVTGARCAKRGYSGGVGFHDGLCALG